MTNLDVDLSKPCLKVLNNLEKLNVWRFLLDRVNEMLQTLDFTYC